MDKDLLHNKLVREILSRIFSGQYENGSKLPPERILSTEFNVSRGTVRQALSSLLELGVIEILHGSGAYVKSISRQLVPQNYLPPDFADVDLKDILFARGTIETACGRLACRHITAAQLKELSSLVSCMEANLENLPLFLKYDIEFHHGIIKASCNRPLITAFEAIYEYHKYSQVFTSRKAGDEESALEFHKKILSALERRDPESLSDAIMAHLNEMGTSTTSKLKKKKNARTKTN